MTSGSGRFGRIGGLLLLAWSGLAAADQSVAVDLPECRARLERRSAEPDVAIVRSDCDLSLASLARLLDAGLASLYADSVSEVHSLFLGRLMAYPQWSQKLAEAAARSPAWNKRTGKPAKAGVNDNAVVAALLNRAAYPEELAVVFAKRGVLACIAGAEKVLVFEAKEHYGREKIPPSLSARDRVPIDAQVWLRLLPISASCGS